MDGCCSNCPIGNQFTLSATAGWLAFGPTVSAAGHGERVSARVVDPLILDHGFETGAACCVH